MAEDLFEDQNPTQLVNVITPEGNLDSVQAQDIQDAMSQGYRVATPDDIKADQIANSPIAQSPIEQGKALLEGVGKSLTFGALPKIEQRLGVPKENIKARAEAFPGTQTIGEILGLATPGGEGKLLTEAGEGAAKALGFSGASKLSKVGSLAVKGAIENGLVQGQDEIARHFIGDPNQSAETAMSDIGLASLIGGGLGGAFGVVSPLWKSTTGTKLGNFLDAIQRRANGESVLMPEEIGNAVSRSGIDISHELKTALSQDPELQNMYQTLRESQTSPGLAVKKDLENFHTRAAESALGALGRSAEDLPGLEDISQFNEGSKVQDLLAKNIESRAEPFKEFNDIKDKFKGVGLSDADKSDIAEKIASHPKTSEFQISPSSPQARFLNTVQNELPGLKDLEGLRLYQSNLWGQVKGNPEMYPVASMVNRILRNSENQILEKAVGSQAPDLAGKLQLLRSAYGDHADLLDTLNSRLHVGKYVGTDSFVSALKEMKPEDILNRLSRPNDAGGLSLLQKEFPEVADQLRRYKTNQILAQAAAKAKGDSPINTKTLFNGIQKLSPEMRDFVLPKEAQGKISAIRTLIEALPERTNPSGTAGTMSKLWSKFPSSAMAMASMLTGHNPIAGYLFGKAGEWLGRDAPDAMRLSFLKFLGTDGPVRPSSFKAAVDFTKSLYRGESKLATGAKNIFKAGKEVLPRQFLPSQQDRDKLQKRLDKVAEDPEHLMNVGGDFSYYMPEHNQALSAAAVRASQYLNQIKPQDGPLGILNHSKIPSQVEKSQYERAMNIAVQPLSIMNHIKEGTIVPKDIEAMRAMYPGLYSHMSNKILEEMNNHLSGENSIPYRTRLGLSLFLGQNLDSSLNPLNMQLSQAGQGPTASQAPAMGMPKQTKGSKQALNKLAGLEATAGQSREQNRVSKWS